LVVAGLVVLSVGPSLGERSAVAWLDEALAFAGVGAVIIGWLVTGAILRPRGSALYGVTLAALLYVVIGVVAVIASESLAFGTSVGTMLRHPVELLGAALIWPAVVLFALGWFGWGPR
jgi:hypothetical protein